VSRVDWVKMRQETCRRAEMGAWGMPACRFVSAALF
jgi:hypothetical protein